MKIETFWFVEKVIWTLTSLFSEHQEKKRGNMVWCNGNDLGFIVSWSLIWISRYYLLVLLPWAVDWVSGSWGPNCKIRVFFELWCWRRLLRVPWTARRSNQSIPEEISPGCSLEGLMLKLKLQYLKDPNAGKDWGQEEKGTTEDEMAGWHHRLDAHEFE